MEQEINPAAEASERLYVPAPVFRTEHAEGRVTRLVEQQAAKVPSDVFLFLSLACMAASLGLEIVGNRRYSRFIGMWVSPLLQMGVYTKLVKTFGAR